MAKKTYFMVQQRTTEVEADNLLQAKKLADIRFGTYQIQMHPDVKEGEIVAQETLYENLQMMLNLSQSDTVIGRAEVHRNQETGRFRLTIHMGERESDLMEHLVDIAKLYAVGFAGVVQKPYEVNHGIEGKPDGQ